MKTPLPVLAALLYAATPLLAQEPTAVDPPTTPPSLLDRPTLTNDFFGAGPALREHGLSASLSLTQFYQGAASGDNPHDWEYGGKQDLFLRLDASKVGLWQGFGINAHYEFVYGHANQNAGGTLLPNNAALMFPGSNRTLSDLSLYFTQQIGDSVTLMFGKINMVDLYAASHEFSGGRGVDTFEHLEFVAPLSGITPPMIFGTILSLKTDPAKFTLMLYDPADRTMETGFSHAFAKGVTLSGSAELTTQFLGNTGRHTFSAAFSTQDGIDFRDIPELLLPGTTPPAGRSHRWYASYALEQTLWRDPNNPKNAWGAFAQAAISDANPNPVHGSALAGISGTSPIPGRSADKLGLGIFYVAFSPDLKRALSPLLPLRDEYGAELFYNCALTPWFHLTADLQLLRPGLANQDPALLAGIRGQIQF